MCPPEGEGRPDWRLRHPRCWKPCFSRALPRWITARFTDLTFRAQCSVPEGTFFHECKEYRHKDEDVDGGRNHSSHDGCGNWLHHVRADSALPQDGQEAGENSRDGHQFWPQSLYSPFNGCCFNVFMLQGNT